MQRPSKKTLALIGDGSIQDFLEANEISALAPFFRIYFNLNGYG